MAVLIRQKDGCAFRCTVVIGVFDTCRVRCAHRGNAAVFDTSAIIKRFGVQKAVGANRIGAGSIIYIDGIKRRGEIGRVITIPGGIDGIA